MPRRLLVALAATGAALGVFAGQASASGPAPPGKEIVEVTCEGGIEPFSVSVARGENSKGVGQIVGEKGHGIPVTDSFTLTDLESGEVLFRETRLAGGGHAHPHQATVPCTGVGFLGSAEEFFGSELPEEVNPSDQLEGVFNVDVILKK